MSISYEDIKGIDISVNINGRAITRLSDDVYIVILVSTKKTVFEGNAVGVTKYINQEV